MLKKIKMLRNQAGCADGITHRLYKEGEVVDLPESLTRLFIEMGAAEPVLEEKMMPGAPLDKEMKESPEDKEEAVEEEGEELPDRLNAEVIFKMDKKEKAQMKYMVERFSRPQLEELIEREELPLKPTPTWRDDTVTKRVLEALGL